MFQNNPFQPNMYQQRLNNLQYGMNVPMYIVRSADDVSAAPINYDGSCTYFLCKEQNTIFSKEMDNNGLPLIKAYRLAPQEKVRTTDDRLNDMEAKLDMLFAKFAGEKKEEEVK